MVARTASVPARGCDGWDPERGGPVEFGLALSGGGFRATLFHLGAITRINEMGKLRSIGRVASVSGGSFAAGLLAKAWPYLEWDSGVATNLDEQFARPVLELTGRRLDAPYIAIGLIPGVNPAHRFARLLDTDVFGGMRLADLPSDEDGPRFIFNASEMATGTLYRFSKPYMGSYRIGLVPEPDVPLAWAVAASAAFPPIFSPFVLETDPGSVCEVEGADLWGDQSLRSRVALLDGGAYDNLALEPITGRCETYLVSDAGGNYSVDGGRWKSRLWSWQLKRTLDMAVSQSRALRKRELFLTKDEHPFALWRTSSTPADLAPVIERPFGTDPRWPRYLSALKTRMWPFSQADRCRLVNWGYLTADLSLRSYVWTDATVPKAPPYPDYGFEQAPASARTSAGPER
jgi:NTE family protein